MLDNGITKKTIMSETGAPGYMVNYLRESGRLPILKESKGRGYPTIFKAPEVIEIVNEHLQKRMR